MTDINHTRSVFIGGLKNAHAIENKALSIMQPQINRLTHCPELLTRLEEHVSETEGQIDRLDQILDTLGESSFKVKDTFFSAFGSMAALGHFIAGDEAIKNSFANPAFENYEIAAYTSLLTAAQASGEDNTIGFLEQSLAGAAGGGMGGRTYSGRDATIHLS